MSGSCRSCMNVRFDAETNQYECHFYVPERGDNGWGAWPIVDPRWDCRQYLHSLVTPLRIADKNSYSGQFHEPPDLDAKRD